MIDNYPIFTKWYLIMNLILDHVEKFPKHLRFSVNNRILNLNADILELIIELLYSKEKISFIDKINLNLEKLRIYFRICEERKFLSKKQAYRIQREFDEFGKMIGGWKRSLL